MNGVSIIVCCYNSATRLSETIKHLSQVTPPPGVPIEIIVVDNASTDNTAIVAKNEWTKNGGSALFKVVYEEQAGLSFAREKGINEAQYEYIIFCDDDNWLAPDYIEVAFEVLSRTPEIGVLTGRSEAISDSEFPYWFFTYQTYYAVGVLGLKSGDVSERGEIWGAGMSFRKSEYLMLRKVGFKSLLSDRKGASLSSGGDTEICKWYLLSGKKLWYDDRLSFKHFIEKSRLTPDYIENFKLHNVQAQKILQKYELVHNAMMQKKRISIWLQFVKHLITIIFFRKKKDQLAYSLAFLEAFNPLSIITFDSTVCDIKQVCKRLKVSKLQ